MEIKKGKFSDGKIRHSVLYLNPLQIDGVHNWTLKKLDGCEVSLEETFQLQVGRFPEFTILTNDSSNKYKIRKHDAPKKFNFLKSAKASEPKALKNELQAYLLGTNILEKGMNNIWAWLTFFNFTNLFFRFYAVFKMNIWIVYNVIIFIIH